MVKQNLDVCGNAVLSVLDQDQNPQNLKKARRRRKEEKNANQE
jgi:hypothetical protein